MTDFYAFLAKKGYGNVSAAREGQHEVREHDEDALRKRDEIIELLLAAGYFRARISTLSYFDKILGGLAWSISASMVDVDVDVFFTDDAQVKEKIKCGEDVCKALLRMRCPHQLESFQIRGLDYPKLFPVVQWLVKKVFSHREENAALLRGAGERHFSKRLTQLPSDAQAAQRQPQATAFVASVAQAYGPRRRFRRAHRDQAQEALQERVSATLMEYGQHGGEAGEGAGDGGDAGFAAWAAREGVAGSVLGGIMGMQAQELADARAAYARAGGTARSLASDPKAFAAEQHRRQVAAKERQVVAQQQTLSELKAQHAAMQQSLQELMDALAKRRDINARIEAEIARFNAMETGETADDIATLRSLVALNESLKRQMSDFKENCKAQMSELKEKAQQLRETGGEGPEAERLAMIEETHAADAAKLQHYRQLLAKKNRAILMLERKIDEVPSRTELSQYQREFVELYEQVASKLMETRQYYNTYNTLEDTRVFLAREVSILNSINDQYAMAMKTRTNKAALLSSMKDIVDSVQKSYDSTVAKQDGEKGTRDALQAQVQQLLDRERAFHQLTRDFEEEARKSAALQSRLASGGA